MNKDFLILQPQKGDQGNADSVKVVPSVNNGGIFYEPEGEPSKNRLASSGKFARQAELVSFLMQLEEEGFAIWAEGRFFLPWSSYYELTENEDHAKSLDLLGLPPLQEWRPVLSSRGSLADQDFSIVLSGWLDPHGLPVRSSVSLLGPQLSSGNKVILLPRAAWDTVELIAEHHRTPAHERNEGSNKCTWGKIRRAAIRAKADLSDFLRRTIVLSPERLQIDLRKAQFGQCKTVEVCPVFEGAPERWLEIFDRFSDVRAQYQISDGQGLTHIVLSPEVQTVLKEIKRMPGRRVAGARAEAFVHNPFASLGPAADNVIDPEAFEKARVAAGLCDISHEDQAPPSVTMEELFDLANYSDRVSGFGVEQPYFSPWIAKKDKTGGWFPENIVFVLSYTPEGGAEPVAIGLTEDRLTLFRDALTSAKDEGLETFSFPDCPQPIKVAEAEQLLAFFNEARRDIEKGEFNPHAEDAIDDTGKKKISPLLKPNLDALDYEERRGSLQLPDGAVPRIPETLREGISLKSHQHTGLAWLQHLWERSPVDCRGALLADDMGLGKTLQLLCLIAGCLENDAQIDPILIVAPVTLLENWQEEIDKFFLSGTFPVLTLYGPTLSEKRLSTKEIDAELAKSGICRLLRHDWLGNAKVVLTTYETLRNVEFSLARQHWSMVICDEAQKIKNPNALVTRAAKKQNARLKIACTGTPVENTLTDLWCLFDFIQPGLLGSLSSFGSRYRQPIEAETDEDKVRVAELRGIIEPQIMRRTKAEVAKDLPPKVEVEQCRCLPISERQRAFYADAIRQFRTRPPGIQSATGMHSPLGLLQYLRRLCSDPRPPGHVSTGLDSLGEIEAQSPKMAWLLAELAVIKKKDEKVIVFCEFRDLQRTLQRAVAVRFGVHADIVNGDTAIGASNASSRQKRIKAFQQLNGFSVIILSPLAVGFGVNIQAANHVIHFTRPWNPAKEDQATDRVYRIGQTKNVFVYYPVVVAEDFVTFDAKLDKLLDWKRGLSADMLNAASELSLADFDDLEDVDGALAFSNVHLEV